MQTRCNLLSCCQHLECWQGLCTQAGSKLPNPSISEVALICRGTLRSLCPAQPCVLVLAARLEEQRLQFWDFWMGSFWSSDRAFRRAQGKRGGSASPPPSLRPQCPGSGQQIRTLDGV